MGENKKFCICCAVKPVRTCCCGCSLLCACTTLAILQILGGLLVIIVAAAQIHVYKNLDYRYNDSYYSNSSLDKLRSKFVAVFSLELVYGVVLLFSGIMGTMSQRSKESAKMFYYSYFTFIVVYTLVLIIIIIIYGSMFSDVETGVQYDRRIGVTAAVVSQIINLIITIIIQTYFLLVVWSNWQQKELGTGNNYRNDNPGQQQQDIIIIQPQNMIPMQNYNYVPNNNYQPQVQMYQPQVQMYPVGQPQIQEAVVYQNNYDVNPPYGQQQIQMQNNNLNKQLDVKNYQQGAKYQ